MLSLGKLLLLALIVTVVWFGFKYVQRVEEVRRMLRQAQRRQQQQQQQPQAARSGPHTVEAEDLVKCRVCGAYVAARSTTSCGRPDCPWGR